MKNIPGLTDSDDNQGGLRQLLFLPMTELESLPMPNAEGSIDMEIFMGLNDVEFFTIGFTLEGARFTEEEETSGNGPYYKQLIEARVPRDYSYRRKQFTDMEQYEYLVIGIGNSGKAFVIGEIDDYGDKAGMRLKKKFDTKEIFKEGVFYTLQFYKESAKPAIAVINVPLLDISTSTPVDDGLEQEPAGPGIG